MGVGGTLWGSPESIPLKEVLAGLFGLEPPKGFGERRPFKVLFLGAYLRPQVGVPPLLGGGAPEKLNHTLGERGPIQKGGG